MTPTTTTTTTFVCTEKAPDTTVAGPWPLTMALHTKAHTLGQWGLAQDGGGGWLELRLPTCTLRDRTPTRDPTSQHAHAQNTRRLQVAPCGWLTGSRGRRPRTQVACLPSGPLGQPQQSFCNRGGRGNKVEKKIRNVSILCIHFFFTHD